MTLVAPSPWQRLTPPPPRKKAREQGRAGQGARLHVDRGPAQVGLVDLLALQPQHLGDRGPADVNVHQPHLRPAQAQPLVRQSVPKQSRSLRAQPDYDLAGAGAEAGGPRARRCAGRCSAPVHTRRMAGRLGRGSEGAGRACRPRANQNRPALSTPAAGLALALALAPPRPAPRAPPAPAPPARRPAARRRCSCPRRPCPTAPG